MKIILKDKIKLKSKTKSIILVLGLLLIVLAGILSPVSKVDAQERGVCVDDDDKFMRGVEKDECPGQGGTWKLFVGLSAVLQDPIEKPNNSCKSDWFLTPTCAMWGLLQAISGFIFRIGAFILWLAGMILNFVLTYTIVDMAAHINGGTSSFTTPGLRGEILAMTGINQAWKIIRDLMNIAFIFLLVYEGIKMIIGQSSVATAKKFISGVVLASLLINFSLFFTKVMIDASNVITIGLYNSIITDTTEDIAGGGNLAKKRNDNQKKFYSGLSVPYMVKLGISDFTSTKSFEAAAVGGEGNLILFNLMGTIVFLVVAFVFFAVSAMFVIRYITLIFLLMLSPIAFMGLAPLPFISTYTKQWWDSLNGQLLFAPIYMIMNVIILTLMGTPGFLSSTGGWGHLLSSSDAAQQNGAIGLIFNFVVVIGFIILSLVVAKSTSTQGSKFIGEATGKLTTFAGGALMGGAAAVGRKTIGARYERLANNEDLKNRAAKGDKGAQIQLAGYRKLASSSFDVRRSRIGEATASATGVSLGKGTEGVPFFGNDKAGEGGFKKDMEDKAKKKKEMMESLKPSDEAESAHKKSVVDSATNTLNSKEFKDKEEAYYANHPELKSVFEERKLLEKKKEEAEKEEGDTKKSISDKEEKIKQLEEDLKKAEETSSSVEHDEKIKQLEEDLKKAENAKAFPSSLGNIGMLEAEAKNAKIALEAEKAKKVVSEANSKTNKEKIEKEKSQLQEQLKSEQGVLKEKVEANKKAEKDITANKKVEVDKRNEFKSDERKKLEVDKEGKGQTLYQKRGEAYASSIENSVLNQRPGFNEDGEFQWRSSQTAKASAAAVRKTTKGKTAEENLEAYFKQLKKEKEAKGEKVDGDEPVVVKAPEEPKS